MDKDSGFRLVCCPKCRSLLQEFADYPIHKCGACGSVLQAKNNTLDESCRVRSGQKDRIFREDRLGFGDKDVEIDVNRHGKQHGCKPSGKGPMVNWVLSNASDMNMNRSKSVNYGREKRTRDYSKFVRNPRLSSMGHATFAMTNEQARFSGFGYPAEGPSSCKPDSFLHDMQPKKFVQPERPLSGGVQNLGEDQSQLLRILDELKEQIGKTLKLSQKPNEVPMHSQAEQPPHDYFARNYIDLGYDSSASYPWGTFYHGLSCSCLHCRDNDWKVGASSGRRNLVRDQSHSEFRSHVNPINLRRQGHIHVNCMQANVWKGNSDSDIDGLHRGLPRRMIFARGRKRFYHPIAGGAPFVTCYKCLELLKLPGSFRKFQKKKQKLRCGVCSTVIVCEVVNSKLVTCQPEHRLDEHKHTVYGDNGKILRIVESGRDSIAPRSVPFEEEKRTICRESQTAAEMKFSNREFSKMPASASGRSIEGKGSRTRWAEEEEVVMNEGESPVISEENESLETVVEVPFDEYPNTSSSQDSVNVRKEKDQIRNKRGKESPLVGLIKRSLRDSPRTNRSFENGRPKVSANGRPIPESMVKKDETKAGPIHPGDHRYDFRRGVMGRPSLDKIPPFTGEFNYSLPENCAAGNTGVFVNGRELNHSDLDLLASRGLPTTRDKSYVIDIYGKILDKNTNTEQGSLGKLAPSVEAFKRGFHMQVPKAVR